MATTVARADSSPARGLWTQAVTMLRVWRVRRWARARLRRGDAVILDTETTDLHGQIVHISIIDLTGRPLLNTLIRASEPIAAAATAVPSEFRVTALTLSDVVEDLRLLLDGSDADVDGIRASAEKHPAFDPADAGTGEGAMLVTFTDASGRSRIAELQYTARWREDDCWHLTTRPSPLGEECIDCGMVTNPDVVTAQCPECRSPVVDETSLLGVHTPSCAVVMCQCEHIEHEAGGVSHRYLGAVAGSQRAEHVGRICDACGIGHLADYLISDTEVQG